jgi:hypothetical protein
MADKVLCLDGPLKGELVADQGPNMTVSRRIINNPAPMYFRYSLNIVYVGEKPRQFYKVYAIEETDAAVAMFMIDQSELTPFKEIYVE